LSEEALGLFEGMGSQRGMGLALITLGKALRHLGTLWMSGPYEFQECDRNLRQGAAQLDRAVLIFRQVVDEPVRLVEALNEQGALYRERARLAQSISPNSALARTISQDAIGCLTESIDLAQESGLEVWYVDSCEDLAEVYFLRRDYVNTRTWLENAEKSVPDGYKIRAGQKPAKIPEEERIEALWLQMGKVELLRGDLVFDEATDGGSKPATRETLVETVRHYVLSAVYFETYSNRATGLRATFGRMSDRLDRCTFDDLRYLQEEALPSIARSYRIDLTRPGRFFEDTLGLALQLET
jgi:hypothetical protein